MDFTKPKLEAKAFGMIERVKSNGPDEDDFEFECKEQWSDKYYHLARQLAGHANKARTHPIYWLIGVKRNGEVVGAEPTEVSNWWNQVRSHFDGEAPVMHHAIVGTSPASVILAFETDQPPYVVTLPRDERSRGVEREVPWREGTGTRTASRAELLRMLVPSLALPEVFVTQALAERTPNRSDSEFSIYFVLYISARNAAPCTIPYHGWKAWITHRERRIPLTAAMHHGSDLQFSQAARVTMTLFAKSPVPSFRGDREISLTFSVQPDGVERPLVRTISLQRVPGSESSWEYKEGEGGEEFSGGIVRRQDSEWDEEDRDFGDLEEGF